MIELGKNPAVNSVSVPCFFPLTAFSKADGFVSTPELTAQRGEKAVFKNPG